MAHVAAATMQPWLSCMDYCTCAGGVGGFIRFTIKQMSSEDDEVLLSASDDDDEGQYHVYIDNR